MITLHLPFFALTRALAVFTLYVVHVKMTEPPHTSASPLERVDPGLFCIGVFVLLVVDFLRSFLPRSESCLINLFPCDCVQRYSDLLRCLSAADINSEDIQRTINQLRRLPLAELLLIRGGGSGSQRLPECVVSYLPISGYHPVPSPNSYKI